MLARILKRKILIFIAVLGLIASSCSSNSGDSGGGVPAGTAATTTSVVATTTTTEVVPGASEVSDGGFSEVVEEMAVVLPFTASNGEGTVQVSGSSAVAVWFGGLPGEVSLELLDADIGDPASVVEELVSFWFFQDGSSGDVPPSILVSADGVVSDSLGTRYVVEAASFPEAPTATTTTTTTTTTTEPSGSEAGTIVPATSIPQVPTTTTTEPEPEEPEPTSPDFLQVQVLNGSGVSGAAGRMTGRLADAGFVTLPAGNAPRRYATSAIYYAPGWQDEAQAVIQTAAIEQVDQPTPMPASLADDNPQATIIVLLGTDTAPPEPRGTALRPRRNNTVALPLGPEIPRDRYVPGLANINIFSEVNDNGPDEVKGALNALSAWLNVAGNCSQAGAPAGSSWRQENDCTQILNLNPQTAEEQAASAWVNLERTFEYLGFTPQNTCGAPQGYSFTDLIKPAVPFSEDYGHYVTPEPASFITDDLLALPGASESERIFPEENLEGYARLAAQAAYDIERLHELITTVATPQLLLCVAWVMPSFRVADYAIGLWKLQVTGPWPLETLVSQGTYHVRSLNLQGNRSSVYICPPTQNAQIMILWWRSPRYRGWSGNPSSRTGCQAAYTEFDGNGVPWGEPTRKFGYGEQSFTVDDLLPFPRAQQ